MIALLALLGSEPALAQSSSVSTAFCDKSRQTSAAEQDHMLRFAAAVRDALDASGSDTFIISRSGLDLSRFHIRYSHSAIMVRSDTGVWTARQLYYACDEGQPRIYDQGLAGFTQGSDDPALGYISIIVLPADSARAVRQGSQDSATALGLLAATYSANAYAFSIRYQNCNQWLIELLAAAWGDWPDGAVTRAAAQHWLEDAHYDPEPVHVDSPLLMIASLFTPLLHLDDHPKQDRAAMRLQVSLPSTIEAFVKQRLAASERLELCHNAHQIVTHHGWTPIADGCQASADDRVILLD